MPPARCRVRSALGLILVVLIATLTPTSAFAQAVPMPAPSPTGAPEQPPAAIDSTPTPAPATTINGTVRSTTSAPIVGAHVTLVSRTATFTTASDAHGNFTLSGIPPGTYAIEFSAPDYDSMRRSGVVVAVGQTVAEDATLAHEIAAIGGVRVIERSGTPFGQTGDTFLASQVPANAQLAGGGSGLGTYAAGTILGTAATVPGVIQDQFGNLIMRGSKAFDTIYSLDGIPIAQEFISSPGGTTFGAPLSSIGIGTTTVQQAGLLPNSKDAFGGVVNEIPLSGSYPGETNVVIGTGAVSGYKLYEINNTGGTPNGRLTWALSGRYNSAQLYPLGPAFQTPIAGGNGLDYTQQRTNSGLVNLHYKTSATDDFQFLFASGATTYSQYGQPYPGLTIGTLNGLNTLYPAGPASSFNATQPYTAANPYTPITQPGVDTGSDLVEALKWNRLTAQSVTSASLSRGMTAGSAGFIVGSDLTFPLSWNSYLGNFENDVRTLQFSVANTASARNEIDYGASLSSAYVTLNQVEPIIEDVTQSYTRANSWVAYLSDIFKITNRFTLTGGLKAQDIHEARLTDGNNYTISVLDPHVAAAYRFGNLAVSTAYDHVSQPPPAFGVERFDSAAPVPFQPVTFESGDHFLASLESSGKVRFRLSYWLKDDYNRIDVIPLSAIQQSSSSSVAASPSSIGLPANIGRYQAHGEDLSVNVGRLSLTGAFTVINGIDSSQYNLNQINVAQVQAGALIPSAFTPALTGTVKYTIPVGRKTTISPFITYESGLPYGLGTKTYIVGPNGQPELVNNDNHVDPGYAYYFLANPALPFNAVTNPYTSNLNDGEGPGPNTLHTPPRTFLSINVTSHVSKRVTLSLDVSNLLNFTGPTSFLANGYEPGPPGYTGGNPLIAAWMSQQLLTLGASHGLPYILGNGIPTVDGYHPLFNGQFNYGTAPYVAAGFPYPRTVTLTMKVQL